MATDGSCSQCGEPLAADAKFCAYCGAPTVRYAMICPQCRTRNFEDAIYCAECGAPLTPALDAAAAQAALPAPSDAQQSAHALLPPTAMLVGYLHDFLQLRHTD